MGSIEALFVCHLFLFLVFYFEISFLVGSYLALPTLFLVLWTLILTLDADHSLESLLLTSFKGFNCPTSFVVMFKFIF